MYVDNMYKSGLPAVLSDETHGDALFVWLPLAQQAVARWHMALYACYRVLRIAH